MTDHDLRALERQFKQSGSAEDDLAYLLALVRAGETLEWERYSRLAELSVEGAASYLKARVERGELTEEKLELAAYCGHEAAGRALDNGNHSDLPFKVWLESLLQWGKIPFTRAIVACARFLLPDDPGEALKLYSAAEAWCECPCSHHQENAATLFGLALREAASGGTEPGYWGNPWPKAALYSCELVRRDRVPGLSPGFFVEELEEICREDSLTAEGLMRHEVLLWALKNVT